MGTIKLSFPFLIIFLVFSSCQRNFPNEEIPPPRIEFIPCEGLADNTVKSKNYIDRDVTKQGDTTSISFKFMRDCCLEFIGKWEIKDDILTLSYHDHPENEFPCECKCLYQMKFHFNHIDHYWEQIRIKPGI